MNDRNLVIDIVISPAPLLVDILQFFHRWGGRQVPCPVEDALFRTIEGKDVDVAEVVVFGRVLRLAGAGGSDDRSARGNEPVAGERQKYPPRGRPEPFKRALGGKPPIEVKDLERERKVVDHQPSVTQDRGGRRHAEVAGPLSLRANGSHQAPLLVHHDDPVGTRVKDLEIALLIECDVRDSPEGLPVFAGYFAHGVEFLGLRRQHEVGR